MIQEKTINLDSNLKQLLEKKALSLHQLSVQTNINKSSLHNYINGVVPQGLILLVKLSTFFNMSLEELVFEQDFLLSKHHAHNRCQNETKIIEGKYEVIIKKIRII